MSDSRLRRNITKFGQTRRSAPTICRVVMPKIIDLFFPRRCLLCKSLSYRDIDLCQECEDELPEINPACSRCGAPLDSFNKFEFSNCGNCLNLNLPFDNSFSLFYYEKPVSHLLISLKFRQKLIYAKLLGELMADKIVKYYDTNPKPDLIIPVPLHFKRLQERGYNQSLELAKPIAKKLNITIDKFSCSRVKHTKTQSLLSFEDRKTNVRKAFSIVNNISISHVAIIDDILTTGSTVNELSSVLRNVGVEKIDVWTCARVP